MKSITAKIVSLVIAMTFITTSVFAASMSLNEFIEVLNGSFNNNSDYVIGNLPNAYKYVSADQLKAMKVYRDNVSANFDTKVNTANYDLAGSVATKEEVTSLVKDITLLMTFPTKNTNNNVSDQIAAAGTTFYNNSFATLDKLSGNALTKTALGKLVVDLRTNLRAELSKNALSIYNQGTSEDYITKIKDVLASGLAKTFDGADGQLAVVKNNMLDNHMLTMEGDKISSNSPFITIVTKAFDMMDEIDGNYDTASVVANTILVSALDLKVTAKDSSNHSVYPNKNLPSIVEGQTLILTIAPETSIPNISNISSWFDFDDNASQYSANYEDDSIIIKATNDGNCIVKLYRNTDIDHSNELTIDKLMLELPIVITPKTSGGNTGGGGRDTSGSHEIVVGPSTQAPAPEITVDSNGRIIIGSSLADGVIYYTTDGSDPTTSSTIYTTPIPYEAGMQIKAIVVVNGIAQSVVIAFTPKITPKLTTDHISYIIGDEKGLFNADKPITRAEIATAFSRLLASPANIDTTFKAKYTDVFANDWYAEAVMKVTNAGLFTGDGNGLFRPNDYITRAEFATVASKFAEITSANPSQFNDVSGHWAEKYIATASEKGWVVGYEDGTFKPDASITRAEAVTIINRIAERSADKAYIDAQIKNLTTFSDLKKTHWAYYDILEACNQHDYTVTDGKETWK